MNIIKPLVSIRLIFLILLLVSCVTGVTPKDLAVDYYNLGNAYFNIQKYEEAIIFYERAIELDQELLKAQFNLAHSLIKTNQISEALERLILLQEKDPDNLSIKELIAYCHHLLGDDEKALEIYSDILNISPGNIHALYNKAIILWKMEDFDEAEEYFRQVLQFMPDDTDTLFSLGQLLFEIEKKEEAIEYIEQYLQLKPEDIKASKLLATVYTQLEKYYKVLEIYDEIITIDDTQAEVWFEKARILLTKIEDPEKGLTSLQQAIDLEFNDKEKTKQLLEDPDLLEKETVEELLKENNLL
jgi:tetratricopeptide (TPR) repeat protein